MTLLPEFFLTFLGLIFCAGDVTALAILLNWQEMAPSPDERRHRLLRGVVPGTLLLLSLLLLTIVQLTLMWSGQ